MSFRKKKKLVIARDPLGIKPLCIGQIDDGYVVASESAAIEVMGGQVVRDVEPGEILSLSPDEITSHSVTNAENKAFCMFEYVYFARPDAKIDGILTYTVRQKIGRKLWEESPIDADIIVPVPDSGIACALGFSEASKLLKSDRQNLGKDLEKAAKIAGGKKIKISEILSKILNIIGQ